MPTYDEAVQEMMSYYDARAEEYDDIYEGKGHITIDPEAFVREVANVAEMVSGFGEGHLLDIGCGAGFWLPNYAPNCSRITLLDQSERMLSKCRHRVERLGLAAMSSFLQGDFFHLDLAASQYDCALAGFFLSHLMCEQEEDFFRRLALILKPNPRLMLIDSTWNKKRRRYQDKEGVQERVLRDGRRFSVFKRYFTRSDVETMFTRYGFQARSYYVGDALIAAMAEGRGGVAGESATRGGGHNHGSRGDRDAA